MGLVWVKSIICGAVWGPVMTSPGFTAYDAYVDSRGGSLADKAELKAEGERLFHNVFVEMNEFIEVEGDAAVAANIGDIDLAARQTVFKGWYAEARAEGLATHQAIHRQVENEPTRG